MVFKTPVWLFGALLTARALAVGPSADSDPCPREALRDAADRAVVSFLAPPPRDHAGMDAEVRELRASRVARNLGAAYRLARDRQLQTHYSGILDTVAQYVHQLPGEDFPERLHWGAEHTTRVLALFEKDLNFEYSDKPHIRERVALLRALLEHPAFLASPRALAVFEDIAERVKGNTPLRRHQWTHRRPGADVYDLNAGIGSDQLGTFAKLIASPTLWNSPAAVSSVLASVAEVLELMPRPSPTLALRLQLWFRNATGPKNKEVAYHTVYTFESEAERRAIELFAHLRDKTTTEEKRFLREKLRIAIDHSRVGEAIEDAKRILNGEYQNAVWATP